METTTAGALSGRTLYIPPMTYSGARMLAAAFQSIGVTARLSPESDQRTLDLGGRYISGEECLPMKVTLGDFLKIVLADDFDPDKTAFLMMTANGPCRFGQYRTLIRKVLHEFGHDDVPVVSPTSADGYQAIGGEHGSVFMRTGWRAMVVGDILTKALLRTRPYELRTGDADEVFERSLDRMGEIVARVYEGAGEQMTRLVEGLTLCRREFESIPADYDEPKLLIGVVGEIFCRLNDFSNDSTIRKLEEYGCEAWLSDVAEWVFYTNNDEMFNWKLDGHSRWHPHYWKAWLRNVVQKRDEHALVAAFGSYFDGYEEPEVEVVLDSARPYLPREGALGEMVLSTGKAVWLHGRGVDGIVDISPFTCMNGIITEAIYPKVSREHDGMPIRTFYFDGISSDLDRDVGIFAELARSYRRRKKTPRPTPTRPDLPAVAV